MTGILRGELGKTLSTRTLAAFALVCIGFGALNAVIIGAERELDTLAEKDEALTCLPCCWSSGVWSGLLASTDTAPPPRLRWPPPSPPLSC